jgi:tetratricopeptide (TPR) repeat protein
MLEELQQKDPEYLATYYQLGKMQEENGLPEKAISTYQSGIELAKKQNDRKALGELNEALMLLEE